MNPIDNLTKEEIGNACKSSRCFRQALAVLKCHLRFIETLAERVKKEGIDVSHFNKGDITCPKCGKTYKVMNILDFDDVRRKLGSCDGCKNTEWVEDGGYIMDAWSYFTTGETKIVGYTEI